MPCKTSLAECVTRVKQSAQATFDNGLHILAFRAMSTDCLVNFHDVPVATAHGIQHDIVEWVGQFKARYSRFIPDSLVSQINQAAGENWVKIGPLTELILDQCQEFFNSLRVRLTLFCG